MGCNSSAPKQDAYKPTATGTTATTGSVPAAKSSDAQPIGEVLDTDGGVEDKVEQALKIKKRAKQQFMGASVAVDSNYVKKKIDKTAAQSDFIRAALLEHFLFGALDKNELTDVVNALEFESVPKNTEVIKEGDKGTFFYLIQKGHFDVTVKGNKVHHYDVKGGFGELALLYDCPRAASVVSTVDSEVWKLDRETFRHTLANNTQKNIIESRQAVAKVSILQGLDESQLDKVAEAVQVFHYKKGDLIIKKGDVGAIFYMIKSGNVKCTDLGKGSDLELGPGEYFGERALLLDEPRAGNVYALDDVTLLALDRVNFENLLGPLRETLDYNLGIRVLKSVPLLAKLEQKERSKLVKELVERHFKAGAYIIKQGEPGSEFFIVKNGELKVTATNSGAEVEIGGLAAGEYFGEQALQNDAPRAANVKAVTDVTLFVLARKKFEEILGPLSAVLDRVIKERKEMVKDIVNKRSMDSDIKFSDLKMIRTLGTGTFGRVKQVQHTKTGKVYALKCLQKAQVVAYKQETNIMNEKNLLQEAVHPFILQLVTTFKDKNCLYMLLELVQGGELFSLLHNQGGKIPSKNGQFYAGCVVSALSFLHDKYIVYRDLKPENLLIDKQGFCKVVDFGFAKIVKDRTFTLCGTPEYLAPELVLGKGHNKGVDYWAIGVLIYEMLCGYSPFADHDNNDQMAICKNIIRNKVDYPKRFTDTKAKDIIKRLLEKEQVQRLGCLKHGADDIKNHEWFKGLDWAKLDARQLTPPWIPDIKDDLDSSNFDNYEEDVEVEEYYDDGSNWYAEF